MKDVAEEIGHSVGVPMETDPPVRVTRDDDKVRGPNVANSIAPLAVIVARWEADAIGVMSPFLSLPAVSGREAVAPNKAIPEPARATPAATSLRVSFVAMLSFRRFSLEAAHPA